MSSIGPPVGPPPPPRHHHHHRQQQQQQQAQPPPPPPSSSYAQPVPQYEYYYAQQQQQQQQNELQQQQAMSATPGYGYDHTQMYAYPYAHTGQEYQQYYYQRSHSEQAGPAEPAGGALADNAGAHATADGDAGGSGGDGGSEQPKRKRNHIREAGGTRWVDNSLDEWPKDDFRIFVGNLGWEVNDEVLSKAFQSRYASFQRAKVVRDKKMNKVRGYGFVSFSDFVEGARALKEMDGKYIGNRPVKLSKSTWASRERAAGGDGGAGANGNGGAAGVGGKARFKKQKRNPKMYGKHLPL